MRRIFTHAEDMQIPRLLERIGKERAVESVIGMRRHERETETKTGYEQGMVKIARRAPELYDVADL